MADAERYRIPEVFIEAHRRGFSGLPLVANPTELLDPDGGPAVAPTAHSHPTILKRRFTEGTARRMLQRLEEASAARRRRA